VALPGKASPVAYGDDFHPPVETGGIKIGRIKSLQSSFIPQMDKHNINVVQSTYKIFLFDS